MSDYREYPAKLERVVDGDTMDLTVDVGFRTYKKIRVRIRDIDTREIYGTEKDSEEYQVGMEQKEFAEEFLDREGEWPLTVRTMHEERGKYGRWMAILFAGDERYSEKLIEKWPEAENVAS